MSLPTPIRRPGNWVINPIGPSPIGGDCHDTFRVDPLGNISGGHTTVRGPGGQTKHLPW
jgi:hypothetical protein